MKGRVRVRCWRPDDTLNRARIDTGFIPNTILDTGRNAMATENTWLTHCMVGTNNTTPVKTHTKLLGKVAETADIVESNTATQGTAPYYGWKDQTFRFPIGAGHGGENLSEASIGWDGGSGDVAISRALLIDPSSQLETTITPLADELLDVTWRFEYYPPLVDVNDSMTLNGVNYDTIVRAAAVTSAAWSQKIGTKIEDYVTVTSDMAAFDGAMGAITSTPTGNSDNLSNIGEAFTETYLPNSYQVVIGASVGPNAWVLGSGIRCLTALTTAGQYQMSFSSNPGGSTVPKTTSELMVMKWILSWAEKA
jgi:hypothetical protein